MSACVLCLALITLTGCDSADTDSGITVTPEETDLEGAGASVLLTASAPTPPEEADDTAAAAAETNETTQTLYLDLEWEVSNPALGFILSQAGYTAVYESNGTIGQNVVRVMDQAGNEGEALINQRAAGSSEE